MDPKKHYNEECYGLRGCLHCQDCLAFAVLYVRDPAYSDDKPREVRRKLALKFLVNAISAEALPCDRALRSVDLKEYLKALLAGGGSLPICHYELAPEAFASGFRSAGDRTAGDRAGRGDAP